MNEQPLISVIVPVYNVEKYLPSCIESIVSQTYKNLEIILVDDGSTDNSLEICNDFAKSDSRIKVIHKENGGLSSARNAGLDICKGEYIAFVDSDDWIDVNTYQLFYSKIVEHQAEVAVCGRYNAVENVLSELFTLDNEVVFNSEETMRNILLFNSMDTSFCDKLFSKEVLKDVKFPLGRLYEDTFIICKVIKQAKTIVHVGRPLYYYRCRKNSISRSAISEKSFQLLISANEIKNTTIENFPNLHKEAEAFYYRAVLILLSSIESAQSNEFKTQKRELVKLLRKNITLLTNKYINPTYRVKAALFMVGLYTPVYWIIKKLR